MKSKISHSDTLRILEIAFTQTRKDVLGALADIDRTEPEFFDALEEHSKGKNMTSEQWLRIFQMYPSSVFRKRFDVHKLLSENDQRKLADFDRG